MKELIMNMCVGPDGYGAYSVNCEGIYAAGATIDACKKDTEVAIGLIKSELPVENWPEPIKDEYRIVWHFDF